FFQFHKLQRGDVAGLENHRRRTAGIQRFLPALYAKTPLVPILQARKVILWARRAQVIAARLRKLEETGAHPDANRMLAHISGAGAAETIAVESGHRFPA